MALRVFGLVLFSIFLTGQLTTAQSRPDVQPPPDSQHQASTWPSSPYLDPELRNEASEQQDNVCYTMRTYLFARRDGGPLQHVATLTCTPSRQRDLKRAKAEPKLIPAQ